MIYFVLGTTAAASAIAGAIYHCCTGRATPDHAMRASASTTLAHRQPSWPAQQCASRANENAVTKYEYSSQVPHHLKDTNEKVLALYTSGTVLNFTASEFLVIDKHADYLSRTNKQAFIDFRSTRETNINNHWGNVGLRVSNSFEQNTPVANVDRTSVSSTTASIVRRHILPGAVDAVSGKKANVVIKGRGGR